jgi:outer membrane protein
MVSALCMTFGDSVHAQVKIGYISSQDLISMMPETKIADSTLQDYRAALVQDAQDKQNAFYAAVDSFNRDSVHMTDAEKSVKKADLASTSQELSNENQYIQQQLQQKQQELLAPINKKAVDAIQAVAKENGYTFIFEKDALVVSPPGTDILPLVAKKLNLKVPEQESGGN